MNKKTIVRVMMQVFVVLGVLIIFTSCSPKEADKAEDPTNKAPVENEVISEASPIPKIGQDQPFYDFYNQVAINQTKTEVNNALGVEPVIDADGSYTYTDPSTGYSVNVVYSASDLVTMKVLLPPVGGGDWFKLAPADVTESQVSSIVEGMTYEEVKNILGSDGLEGGVMVYPGSNDVVVYLLMWLNPDFSSITVAFDSETGEVFLAEFTEVPA